MTLIPPYQAEVFRISPKGFNPKVETAACYIHFDGKYLFLHRSKGTPQGNTWGVPAGKMEQGEKPFQTVIREVHEEINILLNEDGLKDVGTLYVRYPHVDFVYHMFTQDCLHCPKVKLSDEHQDYRWVTFQEAIQLPLISGAKETIHHYKALVKNLTITRKPFYFLRHGETIWTTQQILTGETDISLTSQGKSQAYNTRTKVEKLPINTVCFSPLIRAVETKDIVAAEHTLKHIELHDLRECNYDVWLKMINLEKGTGYEVCEKVQEFIDQAVRGIATAIDQEGTVLIVAHGGIHWAMCYHMMINNHPWKIDNCQLVHFKPLDTNKWSATTIS